MNGVIVVKRLGKMEASFRRRSHFASRIDACDTGLDLPREGRMLVTHTCCSAIHLKRFRTKSKQGRNAIRLSLVSYAVLFVRPSEFSALLYCCRLYDKQNFKVYERLFSIMRAQICSTISSSLEEEKCKTLLKSSSKLPSYRRLHGTQPELAREARNS